MHNDEGTQITKANVTVYPIDNESAVELLQSVSTAIIITVGQCMV